MIFYTWSQTESGKKYDPGFQRSVEWDIPLLEGYPYRFVKNISSEPGSHHFKGIDNPSLIKEIKDWGADEVLVFGWSFRSHYKVLKYFKGKIPVLFRGDSTLLDDQPRYKKILRRFILRHVYKNIDRALFVGKANKAYFLANGLREEQLTRIPHAVENERFMPIADVKESSGKTRKDLDIPADAIVFLFAAKLEPKKQPLELAETFVQIENNKSYLVIAGSGILSKELQARYGNHPRVRLMDFQNQQQMPALYAVCDVFILPSKGPNETWGLAINEAMASGKAIIASTACGAAYDLVDLDNGFVFEKNSLRDLSESMNSFISDPSLALKMGNASLTKIQRYSILNNCMILEKIVGEITA